MTPVPHEALDAVAPAHESAAQSTSPIPSRRAPGPEVGGDAKSRARKALLELGPAVAGEKGDTKTYVAARIAWNDFGLPEADAFELIQEYNQSCQPPFEEARLQRIFSSAVKKGPCEKGRGWRMARGGSAPSFVVRDESQIHPQDNLVSWKFRPMTSPFFASAKFHTDWLVRGMLVKGQPAIVAGPPKALKTSIMVDMAISLASGSKFLGAFDVVQKKRVCFLSGESGEATLQETALRICKAKGVKLEDLDLEWMFDLPQLANADHLAELEAGLGDAGAEVLVLDPLYLSLLSGGNSRVDERSLYQMGDHLRQVARACLRAGTTPILTHHANRGLKRGEQMELHHLSYAGIPEFARQWILLNRTSAYQGNGAHDLIMSFGGSAGHGGVWSVRIEEGVIQDDFTARSWVVKALPASDAREAAKAKKEAEKETIKRTKHVEQEDKVLQAIAEICAMESAATKSKISTQTGYSSKVVNETVSRLLQNEARVEVCKFEKPTGKGNTTGKRMKEYEGYRRATRTAKTEEEQCSTDLAD